MVKYKSKKCNDKLPVEVLFSFIFNLNFVPCIIKHYKSLLLASLVKVKSL